MKSHKKYKNYICKNCWTIRQKEYNDKNREKIRELQKRSYQKNKDKRREYARRWRKTPQGKIYCSEQSLKRGINKKLIIHKFTAEEWEKKLNDTNGFCPRCKKYVGIDKLTLDHIIPINKATLGSVYTIDDVQPLCRSCNSAKGNNIEPSNSSIELDTPVEESYKLLSILLVQNPDLYIKYNRALDGIYDLNEEEIFNIYSIISGRRL